MMNLALESLLFEKKLELVNIYKVHKSEYYLKDILDELYKRKFEHMNNYFIKNDNNTSFENKVSCMFLTILA